jgi:alkylated DNA repair dioxygenase AlkB
MSQLSMFPSQDRQRSPVEVDVGSDAVVVLEETYIEPAHADDLFARLVNLAGWRQDHIRLYGRAVPLPRLHRWFAVSNEPYRWSGIDMVPEPFPVFLEPLRRRLSADVGVNFNTALGNLYRSGSDSVSWHSDDEPDLGPAPHIASISLGAARRFLLRHKTDHSRRHAVELRHGSLLRMSGMTQLHWEHCLPKTSRVAQSRVNLTFRAIDMRGSNR